MSLVSSWTRKIETSGTTKVFAASTAAVGTLIVFALNCVNNVTYNTLSDAKGNTYTKVAQMNNSTNGTCALYIGRVDTALTGSDNFTLALSNTTSRFAAVIAVFDELFFTAVSVGSSTDALSTQAVSTAQVSTGVARHLTLTVIGSTATGSPVSAGSGNILVDQIVTTSGASDRCVALMYEYETDGTAQGKGSLAGAAVWQAVMGAVQATPLTPTPVTSVIVGGVKKTVGTRSVIVGGVKKTVTSRSVIIGGVKKPTV